MVEYKNTGVVLGDKLDEEKENPMRIQVDIEVEAPRDELIDYFFVKWLDFKEELHQELKDGEILED